MLREDLECDEPEQSCHEFHGSARKNQRLASDEDKKAPERCKPWLSGPDAGLRAKVHEC